MSARRERFGAMGDGTTVERIVLSGAHGFEVAILTYGAAIQSILAPDASGRLTDVVLGHDDFDAYAKTRNFFGATIGRSANRIAGGRFRLGDRTVEIAPNDGPNALHGGAEGFDTKIFAVETAEASRLVLTRTSPDGEEGFPGSLDIRVTYEVVGTRLSLDFEATSDAATVVNLTNHSFFNLSGTGSALSHELSIEADRILPVAPGGIPTGDELDVAGTPFDFRRPVPIEARLRDGHPQIMATRGYDHNWCLTGGRTDTARPVARLFDPASGRAVVLETSEPGLQFYSGNVLDGSVLGKGSRAYRQGDGICLEPQGWPDSPNRPAFPSTVLRPGETYRHFIRFVFETGSH